MWEELRNYQEIFVGNNVGRNTGEAPVISMEKSPSWEADSNSAIRGQIIVRNPTVHYLVQ